MLYPYNTATRESIHANLKTSFPADSSYRARSMVLVSGGLDSIALLANLLAYTDHDIHAHHVEMYNVDNRAEAETQSLEHTLAYLRTHYRPFEYSTSRYEMMLGRADRPGPDASVVMFMGARVSFAMGNNHDLFWTGHMRGPMYEFVDAGAVFNACYSFVRTKPIWMMPFINFQKFNIYASIPQELAEMTWSCRFPKYDASGKAWRCGDCHACGASARMRLVAEQHKDNPTAELTIPGVHFYHANEELPCLYPRYDDARNILRCSVCKNCNTLLMRDIRAAKQRDQEIAAQMTAAPVNK